MSAGGNGHAQPGEPAFGWSRAGRGVPPNACRLPSKGAREVCRLVILSSWRDGSKVDGGAPQEELTSSRGARTSQRSAWLRMEPKGEGAVGVTGRRLFPPSGWGLSLCAV
jgi:hypothetical protein